MEYSKADHALSGNIIAVKTYASTVDQFATNTAFLGKYGQIAVAIHPIEGLDTPTLVHSRQTRNLPQIRQNRLPRNLASSPAPIAAYDANSRPKLHRIVAILRESELRGGLARNYGLLRASW